MRCHPKSRSLPRLWLFTDPRIDSTLDAAIRRLPMGSGIVFRHYHLEPSARRTLFRRVSRLARQRGHIVLLADSAGLARRWHADGVHGHSAQVARGRGLIVSQPVHNLMEVRLANRAQVDIAFLSPVFVTRSHPGMQPLGAMRFRQLAAHVRGYVVALGGMSRARAMLLCRKSCHGWAAIDALA